MVAEGEGYGRVVGDVEASLEVIACGVGGQEKLCSRDLEAFESIQACKFVSDSQ